MSHCQICGRAIQSNTGVIAHHGYKREHGWQTDSCMGARNLPYEKSRDLIPKAIRQIENYVKSQEEYIEKITKENLPIPSLRRNAKPINNDESMYSIRQSEFISSLKWQIRSAKKDKEGLQKRFDNWKLTLTERDYRLASLGFAMRLFPEKENDVNLLEKEILKEAEIMLSNGYKE